MRQGRGLMIKACTSSSPGFWPGMLSVVAGAGTGAAERVGEQDDS